MIQFSFPGTPQDNSSLPQGKELSQNLTTQGSTHPRLGLQAEEAQSLGEGVHLL